MALIRLVYEQLDYRIDFSDDRSGLGLLGMFLAIDVRCEESFRSFFLGKETNVIGGNITYLEKREDFVVIHDMYPDIESEYPESIAISYQDFARVLNFWLDFVCKNKPKEVTILLKNGKIFIEMSD